MQFHKNQVLEAKILETNMLGFGVCKIEGAVIFVQNGVAGDLAKIRIIKCAKNYYIARIEKMISPSVDRIDPECRHHRRCGGCTFQHISYEAEKLLKTNHILGCLKKEGLSHVEVLPLLSTNNTARYRNKAQFPVTTGEDGAVSFGFYSPKTHSVCKIDDCWIQDSIFCKIASEVCSFLTQNQILPYDEMNDTGLVRHIYLRRAKVTGEVMLCLVLRNDQFPKEDALCSFITSKFPEIKSIVFNIQDQKTNVILGKKFRTVFGSEKICDILCAKKLLLSPHSFYQVNHDAAEMLYKKAFEMANVSAFDSVIDLYCGIGSISISINSDVRITGVEIVPQAVEDAKENAKLNHLENTKFICGDAADAFRLIQSGAREKTLLILDPPRKGLSADLIFDIAKNEIKHLVYISCNPETLARDLALFNKNGYQFSAVQPVDLFPRTSHVESIVVIDKK